MRKLLTKLDAADFEFLFEIIRGRLSFTSDAKLRAAIDTLTSAAETPDPLSHLHTLLEREIRYLGSSDIAYIYRKVTRRDTGAGVPFREIIFDVYRKLKQKPPDALCTEEELLETLVHAYATDRVQRLPVEEQRELLQSVGMSPGDVGSYLRDNASRFAIPALIQIAGAKVTQRVVTNAVIGTITQYVGRQTAKTLVGQLAARFPVWAEWLGPVAWGVTGLWTVYDLQGPAARKTVPATLYIGLCVLRDDAGK